MANVAQEEEFEHGFELLRKGEYKEAQLFFRPKLDANYLAYYGLATSIFKDDILCGRAWGLGRADEISTLYERAIESNPEAVVSVVGINCSSNSVPREFFFVK